MLDLSSNKITELFKHGAEIPLGILQQIVSLNLSDNPISDIRSTAGQIWTMMPHLNDLQISLFNEEDVDELISQLPCLEYLNNIQVERSERHITNYSHSA